MKKIFSLFVAALASVSLFATDYEWFPIPGLNFASDDAVVSVHATSNFAYEQKQMASDDATNKLWGIKIGSSANTAIDTSFIEISCKGEISALELGVSNVSTSTGTLYALVFSSEEKFDKEEVVGIVVDTAINRSVVSTAHRTINVPEGAQSVRIYRKITIGGKSYGSGSTVDVYYLNISVGAAAVDVATLKDIKIDGVSVEGFDANTLVYNVELPYGTTDVPAVVGVPTQSNESVVVSAAAALPGVTTLTVKSADQTVTKTYLVSFTVSTVASSDNSLKSLKVDGTAIKGFKADSLSYDWVVPYAQTALPVVVAEANDENATVVVTDATVVPGVASVLVTAQNGETQTYMINFTKASAPKDVKQLFMSNGYSAWQAANNDTIHAYYLAGESAPVVDSVKVADGATYEVLANSIKVTGLDGEFAEYPLVVEAVSPLTFTADTIVFDGTESWIKGGYGFDDTKKWKFSKTDTDFTREWNGKTHVEFFLPACATISLKEGAGQSRSMKLYINGVLFDTKTQTKNGWDTFAVAQDSPFMLSIVSNQTSGDGSIGAIVLTEPATPTALETVETAVKAVKVIENGKLYIIRNGVKFNAAGVMVK